VENSVGVKLMVSVKLKTLMVTSIGDKLKTSKRKAMGQSSLLVIV
jgi:hypothetical protein